MNASPTYPVERTRANAFVSERRRFFDKITVGHPSGCWVWIGCLNAGGYGEFRRNGAMRKAHRVALELFADGVPEGLQVDHLCRNRACVNPDHLEPVSQRENGRRGISGHRQRSRSHCPQGHSYDAANTYRYPNGRRSCRLCQRNRMRVTRSQKRDVSA